MDTLLDYPTASLSVDFSSGCLLIKWRGNIDFDEFTSVLIMAAEVSDVHDIDQVIVDRLEQHDLNAQCRVWMKNYFLKKLVRPIIPKLTKVATIEARSTIGQIYAKTISKTVSRSYPNLTYRSFASESAAHQWLNPNTAPTSLEHMMETADAWRARHHLHSDKPNTMNHHQLEQSREQLITSLYQLFFVSR